MDIRCLKIASSEIRNQLCNLLLALFPPVVKCECQTWISQLSSTMIDTLHFISNGDVFCRHKIAAKHSIECLVGCDAFLRRTNRSESNSNIVNWPFLIIASSATSGHKEQFATLHFNYAFTSRASTFSVAVCAEFHRRVQKIKFLINFKAEHVSNIPKKDWKQPPSSP